MNAADVELSVARNVVAPLAPGSRESITLCAEIAGGIRTQSPNL